MTLKIQVSNNKNIQFLKSDTLKEGMPPFQWNERTAGSYKKL